MTKVPNKAAVVPMTSRERTASLSLASIFALRMLGLFLILPVFAVWAQTLPDGGDPFLAGLALGIYGLTQGVLQIPFGAASDRFGRKPVIAIGLVIFVAGSVLAALSTSIEMVIAGRALQGAGAVSAAVTAMISDSVRDAVLTRAMALVGASIGLTFAASLVFSPILAGSIGVPGLFWLTAVLAILAVGVILFIVPDVEKAPVEPGALSEAEAKEKVSFGKVLLDPQLLRLNFGIFVLHMAQMTLFVVIPVKLAAQAFPVAHHWMVYLPAVLIAFAGLMPAIRFAERRGALKRLFISAITLLLAVFAAFSLLDESILGIAFLLLVFFFGFNILEASLPSLVSKSAPASARGLALGVYNTTQSIGLFVGGAAGGWLAGRWGSGAAYAFCAVLMLAWLFIARGMRT
ncbi:MAG: MFS transporter, partial [Duodenibacillus sp.]|nr:MFS transporter [Duodenibacillus sp.]